MTHFHLISIFPEIFQVYTRFGIVGRAIKKEKIAIHTYDLRDFTTDKHRTVDDSPYGGGPGMVLKVEPIFKAIEKIKKDFAISAKNSRIILLSAKGKIFRQKTAQTFAKKYEHLILIAGRYEGVDERVAAYIADEEISVGKYVLSGGELPALTILDATCRLIPEVLGNEDSLLEETYNLPKTNDTEEEGILNFKKDYPVYTRPEVFNGWSVPTELVKGNHKEIETWRQAQRG